MIKKNSKILVLILLLTVVVTCFFVWGYNLPNVDPKHQVVMFTLLSITITILSLAVITVVFHIIHQHKDGENPHQEFALGMPQGSVRALIALSLITSFILISLFLYQSLQKGSVKLENVTRAEYLSIKSEKIISVDTVSHIDSTRSDTFNVRYISSPTEESVDFSNQLITVLGTLVIAISSFYFGSKATEQGTNFTKDVFAKQLDKAYTPTTLEGVSRWDDLNVKQFEVLDSEKKKFLIIDFIKTKGKALMKEFPEITGLSYQIKQVAGLPTGQHALVIQVKQKTSMPIKEIPAYFSYKGYQIPTDLQTRDETVARLDLNNSVSRDKDPEFGMIGIPVKKGDIDYMMSCFHVCFNNELDNEEFNIRKGSENIVSPKFPDPNSKLAGRAIEGRIDDWVDIAICEMNSEVKVNPTSNVANKIHKSPTLTTKNENDLVNFFGAGSEKNVSGAIESIFSSQPITYKAKGGKPIVKTLLGLVQMKGSAVGGDSGAPVFNVYDQLIGLVVASDDKSTYIITAETIELETDYKIQYHA